MLVSAKQTEPIFIDLVIRLHNHKFVTVETKKDIDKYKSTSDVEFNI